jgi:two-component system sensor histidine kinase CpxA
MRIGLYQKIFFWLLLNLLLLGLLGVAIVGGVLMKGSNGLLPTYFFSGNVENSFRAISAHCQYKPVSEWAAILKQYGKEDSLYFALSSLSGEFSLAGVPAIPTQIVRTAVLMPRFPFTLCPDPTIVLPEFDNDDVLPSDGVALKVDTPGIEAGIPSSPQVLYMRTGDPARYWLARALYIPDDAKELRYILLAASSDSFSGHGLFFDVKLMFGILCGVVFVSCLWWWPFIRHISRPLLKMAAVSEQLTREDNSLFSEMPLDANICGVDPKRSDEIGRLAQAINLMSRHLYGTLMRQRRFISYIAHEINSPLARIQLALAVMEDRSSGEAKERVRKIISDVEHLSVLTSDILGFLRTESEQQTPLVEKIELRPFIMELVESEISDVDVRLFAHSEIKIFSYKSYIGRAVSNVLRNAYKYAGGEGLIEVEICEEGGKVSIEVRDKGPGVPETDLHRLAKPFFRSRPNGSQSGAGLGLSIVKYCIEACGGSVRFANREPSGFVVAMQIPKSIQR